MKFVANLLLFLICNIIGFVIGPALYAFLVLKHGMIDYSAASDKLANIETLYMLRVQGTWLICMLFSFSSFFLKSRWKLVFVSLPVILPTILGIAMILSAATTGG